MPQTHCHISVVSPVYRGEKMVAELVRRIVEAMNTLAQAVGTNTADATASTQQGISSANTPNTPPPRTIRL